MRNRSVQFTPQTFDRNPSRDEKGQPLGQIGFSIASFGLTAGAVYAGMKYFPSLVNSRYAPSLYRYVAAFPWERAATTAQRLKAFIVTTDKFAKKLLDRNLVKDPPRYDTKDWTIPARFRSKYAIDKDYAGPRTRTALRADYLARFEEELRIANAQMHGARNARLRAAIEKIETPELKAVMMERINAVLGTTSRVTPSGAVHLSGFVERILNEDPTGEIYNAIKPIVRVGREAEREIKKAAPGPISIRDSIERFFAPIGTETVESAGGITGRRPSIAVGPGLEGTRNAINQFFTTNRIPGGITHLAADEGWDSIAMQRAETKRYSGKFFLKGPEGQALAGLINDIKALSPEIAVSIKPTMSSYRNPGAPTGAFIELDHKGHKVYLKIPFTQRDTGAVMFGGRVKAFQAVIRETQASTGELMPGGGHAVLMALKKDAPKIIEDMLQGNYSYANWRANRAYKGVMDTAPDLAANLSGAMALASYTTSSLQEISGGRFANRMRRTRNRYVEQLLMMKNMDASKGFITLDLETTIAKHGGLQHIWEIGAFMVKPVRSPQSNGPLVEIVQDGGRRMMYSQLVNPGPVWDRWESIDPKFRGDANTEGRLFNIDRTTFKTIKRSTSEPESVFRFFKFIDETTKKFGDLPLVGHYAEDFDIDLLLKLNEKFINEKAYSPEAHAFMSSFDVTSVKRRLVDTWDIALMMTQRGKTVSYGLQDLVRAHVPGAAMYAETHRVQSDSMYAGSLLVEYLKRVKTMSNADLQMLVSASMKRWRKAPYMRPAEAMSKRERFLKKMANHNSRGDAGFLFFFNTTTMSSGRASKGFVSGVGSHELEPWGYAVGQWLSQGETMEANAAKAARSGKLSGRLIQSSKALHAAYNLASLTPEGFTYVKENNATTPNVVTTMMLKAQRIMLGVMEERFGRAGAKRRAQFGSVSPVLNIVFFDDPIFEGGDISLIRKKDAKRIKLGSDVRSIPLNVNDLPMKNGRPDTAGFSSKIRKVVDYINLHGINVTAEEFDDIIAESVRSPDRFTLRPGEAIFRQLNLHGRGYQKFHGKYDALIVGIKEIDDINNPGKVKELRLDYQLEIPVTHGSKIGGPMKSTTLVIDAPHYGHYGLGKNIHMAMSSKVFQKSPYDIIAGGMDFGIQHMRDAMRLEISRISPDAQDAAELRRRIVRRYEEKLDIIRDHMQKSGLPVARASQVRELIGREVNELIGTDLLGDRLVVGSNSEVMQYFDEFLGSNNRAVEFVRNKGISKVNMASGGVPDDVIHEMFIHVSGRAQVNDMDLLKEIEAITNPTGDPEGRILREISPGRMGIAARMTVPFTHQPTIKSMTSAVQAGADPRSIFAHGVRFNPDMMRRISDLAHVNREMAELFGISSEAIRKNLSPAIESLRDWIGASSKRVKRGTGLTSDLAASLQMLGQLEYDQNVPEVHYVRGRGFQVDGTPADADALIRMAKGRGFILNMPVYGEDSQHRVLYYDEKALTQKWLPLSEVTGGKQFIKLPTVPTKAGVDGDVFSSNNQLARGIKNLLEAIQGEKGFGEVDSAFQDLHKIVNYGLGGKNHLWAANASGYVGGAVTMQVGATPPDFLFKRPDGKLNAQFESMMTRGRLAPGTVIMSKNMARRQLGDAVFERVTKSFQENQAAWKARVNSTGFYLPDNVVGRYNGFLLRHPVPTDALIRPTEVLIVDKMYGGQHGGNDLLIADDRTLGWIKGDKDSDTVTVMAPPHAGLEDSHLTRQMNKILASTRRYSYAWEAIEHAGEEKFLMELGDTGQRVFTGVPLFRGEKGRLYAGIKGVGPSDVTHPDYMKPVIEFFRVEPYREQEGKLIKLHAEAQRDHRSTVWLVDNVARETAEDMTAQIRPTLRQVSMAYLDITGAPDGKHETLNLSGGVTELIRRHDNRVSSKSLKRVMLTKEQWEDELIKRDIMKVAIKKTTPSQYMNYQHLMMVQDRLGSAQGPADLSIRAFELFMQEAAYGTKHGYSKALGDEMRDAALALGETDARTSRPTDAAMQAFDKFHTGTWASMVDEETGAKLGRLTPMPRRLVEFMQYAFHEHPLLYMSSPAERLLRPVVGGNQRQAKEAGERFAADNIAMTSDPRLIEPEVARIRESLSEAGYKRRYLGRIQENRAGLAAEGFGETLARNLGRDSAAAIGGVGKIAGAGALVYLATQLFRPNQMGMLGAMPGKGGEVYDTGMTRDEIPRGVPLNIPLYTWESKARVMPELPTVYAKNLAIQRAIYGRLGIQVRTPSQSMAPSINMNYYSNNPQNPQLRAIFNNAVVGGV